MRPNHPIPDEPAPARAAATPAAAIPDEPAPARVAASAMGPVDDDAPAPRTAATASHTTAPADRATDYAAVQGEVGEQYSGYNLMVSAYAVIWAIMMAWLFLLWRKQAGLHARLDGLESALDRAEKKLAGKKS